jgi:DNA-directed DNA polymerase III PolC
MDFIKNSTPDEIKNNILTKIEERGSKDLDTIVLLDTEATDNNGEARVLSLAFSLLDEDGNIIKLPNNEYCLECFFNPLDSDKKLASNYANSKALSITNISHGTLLGTEPLIGTNLKLDTKALLFDDYKDVIKEILTNPYSIPASHTLFDKRILSYEIKDLNPDIEWLDTMKIVRGFLNHKYPDKEKLNSINEMVKKSTPTGSGANSLDGWNFIISKLTNKKFDRTIGGVEMHGAKVDVLLTYFLINQTLNYSIESKEHFNGLVSNIIIERKNKIIEQENNILNSKYFIFENYMKNACFFTYGKKINSSNEFKLEYKKPLFKKFIDSFSFENTNGYNDGFTYLRTSASVASDGNKIVSSVKINDIPKILNNLKDNDIHSLVLLDYFTISTSFAAEEKIIEWKNNNNDYDLRVSVGLTVMLKIDDFKFELNLIPNTMEDFKQIPSINSIAYQNNKSNPYLTLSDLDKDQFNNLNLTIGSTDGVFERILLSDSNNDFNNFNDFVLNSKKNLFFILNEISKSRRNIIFEVSNSSTEFNILKDNLISEFNERSNENLLTVRSNPIDSINLKYHAIVHPGSSKRFDFIDIPKSSPLPSFTLDTSGFSDSSNTFIPRGDTYIPGLLDDWDFIKNKNKQLYDLLKTSTFFNSNELYDLENTSDSNKKRIESDFFLQSGINGLNKRISEAPDGTYSDIDIKEMFSMLEKERKVFEEVGFGGYMLLVQYFVNIGRQTEIVGWGRGSAVGSITSWALEITEVNPHDYPNLSFSRFLNSLSKSFPDIDMDLGNKNRDETSKKIHADHASTNSSAHILTWNTFGLRNSIQSVVSFLLKTDPTLFSDYINKDPKFISNSIINKYFPKPDSTLKSTFSDPDNSLIHDIKNNNTLMEIIETVKGVSGVIKNFGIHPAGICIIESKPTNYLHHVIYSSNGLPVLDLTKKFIEKDGGAIKFDLLSLATLTIINKIINLLSEKDRKIFLSNLKNFESSISKDPKTIELFQKNILMGVFQFDGIAGLLSKKLQPENLSDLVLINAAVRPGIDETKIIENKKNPDNIEYPFPELEDVLGESYGILSYQEQVIHIFMKVGNLSEPEAALAEQHIRKGKDHFFPDIRKKFIDGTILTHQNLPDAKERASLLFDSIVDNSGYSFNKAHALPYTITSMVTAYLKAHYHLEFLKGYIDTKLNDSASNKHTKIQEIITEAKTLGVTFLSPDINNSNLFSSINKQTESFQLGFKNVKGLGSSIVNKIISNRDEFGEFTSLIDFTERMIDTKLVSQTAIKSLIEVGILDSLTIPLSTKINILPSIINEKNIIENSSKDIVTKRNFLLNYFKGHSSKKSLTKYTELPFTHFLEVEYDKLNTLCNIEHPLMNPAVVSLIKNKQSITKEIKTLTDTDTGNLNVVGCIKSVFKSKSGKGWNIIIVDELGNDFHSWLKNNKDGSNPLSEILTDNSVYSLSVDRSKTDDGFFSSLVNFKSIELISNNLDVDKIKIKESIYNKSNCLEISGANMTLLEKILNRDLSFDIKIFGNKIFTPSNMSSLNLKELLLFTLNKHNIHTLALKNSNGNISIFSNGGTNDLFSDSKGNYFEPINNFHEQVIIEGKISAQSFNGKELTNNNGKNTSFNVIDYSYIPDLPSAINIGDTKFTQVGESNFYKNKKNGILYFVSLPNDFVEGSNNISFFTVGPEGDHISIGVKQVPVSLPENDALDNSTNELVKTILDIS